MLLLKTFFQQAWYSMLSQIWTIPSIISLNDDALQTWDTTFI